ncbi:polysaccharide pyruvyl transferase family protein [Agromyces sp. NPDC056523]|uniref:polysaccharide pyruvyl transferase family protein n=1 Tax=Agromyces sp. NPDC056523 TaxID=3345850 RepID=UPI00366D1161
MNHTRPAVRRFRQLRRIAVAATRPRMWRGGVVVPTHWWDGHPNFGDDLTPWLLPNYGVLPIHRVAARARLAGVGSILEFLPTDWSGVIWGSGLMNGEPHVLPSARVLAVRGHLTKELIGAPDDVALGDPGILVARLRPRPKQRWDVALVPHGHHRSHTSFLALAETPGPRVRVVNVHQTAERVVREIGSSGTVVTTSLHGLVTADAYGIPAVWTTLEPALGGGAFKFHDYESVVTPGATRCVPFDPGMSLDDLVGGAAAAPRATVESVCDALEESAARLPQVLRAAGRFPRDLLRVLAGRN